ncbi:DNA replication terminus site-binding protein [Granulosicoccus sp. 3-233]|uniref:DNA replication terminus site-binding protein n=1 Tax=Granulosicoccus sp. 3-233 TaxID=3417969 RepID=UPI003D339021
MESLERMTALQLHEELVEALQTLVGVIRDHCTGVVVFELPTVEVDGVVPTHIEVRKWGSPDSRQKPALDLACDALTRLSMTAGQKSTTTYRLPGVLSVATDLSEAISAINALKDKLQTHLAQAYPDTVARSRACKHIFPGVHMNHVYRHLHVIPENISRLNLTWQCQTPADVWITPAEAIELSEAAIEEETRKVQSGDPDRDRLQALEIALQYFRTLPTPVELTEKDLSGMKPAEMPYQLVRRNYVRPHPRAQLFDPQVKASALHTHAANLPLIRLPSSVSLSVRGLKDYEAGQSRKRSDTKRGFEEISQALHIYGGRPTVDNYRRRLKLQESARRRKNKQSVA